MQRYRPWNGRGFDKPVMAVRQDKRVRNMSKKKKIKTPEEVKKQEQWHIAARRAKQREKRRETLRKQERLKELLLKELQDGKIKETKEADGAEKEG